MAEDEFDELRASAFAIAYRMLGSVSEAEDAVQEGLLRLHRRARAANEKRRSEAVVRGETLPMCGGVASVLERTRARRWLLVHSEPARNAPRRPGRFSPARTQGGRVATLRARVACAR